MQVQVYRVEDIDGRGPWSSSLNTQWMYMRDPLNEKCPGTYLPGHGADANHRFGFNSPQQMINAFAPTMLGRAFSTDKWHVAVYEVAAEHVQEMDEYQITFNVLEARLVKRIKQVPELYDVLKPPADNSEVRTFDARGMGACADVRVPDSAAASVPSPYGDEVRRQGRDREPISMGMEA